jgi:broad specificity phosphatase PhoE
MCGSKAAEAADALLAAAAEARLHRASTLAVIKSSLRRATGRARTLTLLSHLGSDFTAEVIPELVEVTLSHRDALRARELLGQLPYDEAARLVPPAVWDLLTEEDDYDAYRRMAELLRHLGLSDTLQELCRQAAASDDPDVREVAEDFTPPAL